MKADVRETGPLEREVDITLEASEVRTFIDQMVEAYRRRYTIPGFRPGKAPANVVLRRFHDEIEHAVMHELVPRTIEDALAEKKVRPAGPGRISRTRYEPGQPLNVRVQFEVWPEVELKPYDNMEVDQLVEEISPEGVEEHLTMMRERLADLNPVERTAQDGDVLDAELLTVDKAGERIQGTPKEKVSLEVGAPHLLPEFREASRGMAAGDSCDLKVEYPDDYSADQLRGQTRHYRMTAVQIREKKVPPLDDEFARRLDADLDLEGLRARVRLRLESEKRLAARERLEHQIADRLIRENPFDLPGASVQMALDRLAERQREDGQEIDPGELERVYRPHIERAHRRELILAKVAEREGVEVGQTEVEAEIARMAEQEKRAVEDVREDIGDLDRFRDFLFERRVFEALMKKVKVREVMVPARGSAAAAPDVAPESETKEGVPVGSGAGPEAPEERAEKESTDE